MLRMLSNHEFMRKTRRAKVEGIARDIPDLRAHGSDGGTLVLGWGSTHGAIRQAVDSLLEEGHQVAHAHLRYVNPFPSNLGKLLHQYDRVIVPEMNLGQLNHLLRDRYLLDVVSVPKIQGKPFKVREIREAVLAQKLAEA